VRYWCLVFVILTGCSLPRTESPDLTPKQRQAQLYAVKMSYRGKQKLSGLLALRKKEQTLYYTLLDTTGIKLLAGTIQDSQLHVTGGILQKSSLGPIFGEALQRIWLLEPKEKPCSANGFMHFCVDVEKSKIQKFARFGFFPLWSVVIRNDSGLMGERVEYEQPWLDLQLELQEKSRK